MFGSWQPLLNCHGGFHLPMNTVQLLGEEMVTEQQRKNYTQLCSSVPNLTLPVLVKKAKFLRLSCKVTAGTSMNLLITWERGRGS